MQNSNHISREEERVRKTGGERGHRPLSARERRGKYLEMNGAIIEQQLSLLNMTIWRCTLNARVKRRGSSNDGRIAIGPAVHSRSFAQPPSHTTARHHSLSSSDISFYGIWWHRRETLRRSTATAARPGQKGGRRIKKKGRGGGGGKRIAGNWELNPRR